MPASRWTLLVSISKGRFVISIGVARLGVKEVWADGRSRQRSALVGRAMVANVIQPIVIGNRTLSPATLFQRHVFLSPTNNTTEERSLERHTALGNLIIQARSYEDDTALIQQAVLVAVLVMGGIGTQEAAAHEISSFNRIEHRSVALLRRVVSMLTTCMANGLVFPTPRAILPTATVILYPHHVVAKTAATNINLKTEEAQRHKPLHHENHASLFL